MSYKKFDTEDVVISAESITAPVWTGDQVTLTSFFTSSTQTGGSSGDYYYEVYQTSSVSSGARVQFSVAYADKKGSGSLLFNDNVSGKSPSSTVYGQYRSLVLGDEDTDFTFGNTTSEHFYVLNIDRANYKEKLLPGSTNIVLGISGSSARLNLTDNSRITPTINFTDAGRVYELITGSLGVKASSALNDNGYTNGSGSYGKFLPDVGVILLNGKALDGNIADGGLELGSNRQANTAGRNLNKIYDILKGNSDNGFRIQSEETVSSNFIFVRARNSEFNYSTNPSLITGSGELRYDVMINTPQSYITTVGLYNDNNDLLAVAKLSRPLLKDFNKEALIRIKLDY